MNKSGPIIVIEDDQDDREIFATVFEELNYPNEIRFFADGTDALEYLQDENVHPFLILSDVNMPRLDGYELRQKIYTNAELSKKCIPYVFFTTSVNKRAVYDAYTMSVQGFFVKPDSYGQVKDTIAIIIDYWQKCYSPNQF